MDTKDKLVEKLKELLLNLKTGFDKFKAGDLSCSEISKLESEIVALDRQILDEGWKELENSGLDKPFIPSQVEEQKYKDRPNPTNVNPYDSKAYKRTRNQK